MMTDERLAEIVKWDEQWGSAESEELIDEVVRLRGVVNAVRHSCRVLRRFHDSITTNSAVDEIEAVVS